MTLPFIACASITAISAIISLGFSMAAALGASNTARTMALYACARSTALVIASAVPFITGSTGWLQAVAWSMIIVQAGDAAIGGTIKDPMKTYGPAGTALLNLAAVIWLIQAVRFGAS
ncbi:hypothetical protein IVB38_08125 [Bradyrhizobium sp. 38]|uniref:hypothetical protein n=1 Tax=unclassified Bradyrhizobium TaxID=2631580 RepID=UPI001FFBB9A3|nr:MULTISPECIES: hypothetical protein [unclassified Bradyrhizobium]MCK1335998.1 hypothetical protein [Bradyrhizobium sp. 38]MCK1780267.1 hypothetical protein [Bradyrhizobium sp. 132]